MLFIKVFDKFKGMDKDTDAENFPAVSPSFCSCGNHRAASLLAAFTLAHINEHIAQIIDYCSELYTEPKQDVGS